MEAGGEGAGAGKHRGYVSWLSSSVPQPQSVEGAGRRRDGNLPALPEADFSEIFKKYLDL